MGTNNQETDMDLHPLSFRPAMMFKSLRLQVIVHSDKDTA